LQVHESSCGFGAEIIFVAGILPASGACGAWLHGEYDVRQIGTLAEEVSVIKTRSARMLFCGALASTPDPVLSPDAVPNAPALSPDQMSAPPVLVPGAVPNDPALSPDQMSAPQILSPDAIPGAPVLSPDAVRNDPALSPD
jgi:hypothetical protein